jgi:hypothetical protein
VKEEKEEARPLGRSRCTPSVEEPPSTSSMTTSSATTSEVSFKIMTSMLKDKSPPLLAFYGINRTATLLLSSAMLI